MQYQIGKSVVTTSTIFKGNQNVRIVEPDRVPGNAIIIGTRGTIVGFDGRTVSVELSSPSWPKNVIVHVPIYMAGTVLKTA